MKTKNLIIGVLTVAVVTLSVFLYRAHTDSSHKLALNQKESNKPSSSNTIEEIYDCDDKDTLISTDGVAVKWDTVKHIVDSFESDKEVRAFHIGIDNMNRLISSINSYNKDASAGNKIVGLRFYKAITTRTYVSSGNIPRTVTETPDLIVVPTLPEKNLHSVNATVPVPIYWHFRPCPKLCRKK
ncbi:hypothetical protein [Fluviicola sp.]|uniref:hypothetical protein n=1 Tax=Fluviicola sp. TaxID=1917219 RepID=UPI003D29AB76